uniref:Nuclear speckle splicing regulatory protein 1 n=1 Tax=Leptobrachium leishanense TaxID=445787 RepID=A0A8C5PZG4_9ANUR
MAAPGKQYGLILTKKTLQKNAFLPKPSVFGDDSDDEMTVGESIKKEALKKRVMKQTKLEMQKALEEDSSVYEYDSVYDDLQKTKEENNSKMLTGQDKKPKYIQNIMKAVEVRKKEQEKRMEKKIQKEREMEGEEFQDKEAFVTSAYKKRLQEKAEEEEREKREAEIEASLDVTKQKDLSGFYRHLLNQTVGEEEAPECSMRSAGVKLEKSRGYSDEAGQEKRVDGPVQVSNVKIEENLDADSDLGSESSGEEDTSDKKKAASTIKSNKGEMKGGNNKDRKKSRHSSSSSEESDDYVDLKGRHKAGDAGRTEKYKYQKHRGQEFKDRQGEHGSKDRHRHREEQDYRSRDRERKENENRNKDSRRERDREYTERDRPRTEKGEREKERGSRHKEKKQDRRDLEKHRKLDEEDQTDRDGKNRDNKEKSPQCSGNDDDTQHVSDSDSKRKVKEITEATQEDDSTQTSKFAKRSSEETVLSARDRYLARQMARIGNKAYVEKEED